MRSPWAIPNDPRIAESEMARVFPAPVNDSRPPVWDEIPTCPTCRGALRRREGRLTCDLHGAVEPVWEPREEEQ